MEISFTNIHKLSDDRKDINITLLCCMFVYGVWPVSYSTRTLPVPVYVRQKKPKKRYCI